MKRRSWIAITVAGAFALLAVPVLAQPGIHLGPGGGGQSAVAGQPLTLDQAQAAARQFVAQSGITAVAPAHIMEFTNNFYVAVTDTATGQGAFELLVDRYSGVVHPEPQSMMWNTKYGRMAGGPGPGRRGPGGPMMGSGFGPGGVGPVQQGPGGPMTVGPSGSRPGAPVNGVRHDSAFAADMRLVHALLLNHDKITRSVTKLSNGIRTVTESSDPQVASLIKAHVASMAQRLQNGSEFNVASYTLPTIFQNADKIRTQIQQTVKGVIVTQTSDDPATVAALQGHASEVDDLVQGGMAAFMRTVMANGGPGGMGPGGPMMGGGFGPGAVGQVPAGSASPVTLDQAKGRAQQYLDRQLPGTKVDETRTFPGYYTFDVSRNAKPVGMLSVNASTGQVWYHVWHGAFIQERDLK